MLACTLRREDARDALILGPGCADRPIPTRRSPRCPWRALVGTSSVRRQAQLLHARPDLRIASLRGNVQTRLDKLAGGACDATLLALAGLRRLGLADARRVVLDPETMVPAAGQGIVGVTVRADDIELRELLSAIEDAEARAVATAERALLARLDGSCRTPIGGHARLLPNGDLRLTGLVAAHGRIVPAQAHHGGTGPRSGADRHRTGRQPAGRTALATFLRDAMRTSILVTRPEPMASATAARLAALGLPSVIAPMLEIRPVPVNLPDPGARSRRCWSRARPPSPASRRRTTVCRCSRSVT